MAFVPVTVISYNERVQSPSTKVINSDYIIDITENGSGSIIQYLENKSKVEKVTIEVTENYIYISSLLNKQTSSLDYGAQIDAGGRLRVSQLFTQVDLKQINDNQPLQLDRETSGAGASQTYDITKGGSVMSVSDSGEYCICQSKQWATYFSGKSQFIEITFNGYENVADTSKLAGYFSTSTSAPYNTVYDGVWFEADGTDYRLKINKSGTEILNVAKSEWNQYYEDIDDWFDPSKFNVLVIQFLYLGGTAVKFGFIKNGAIEWVHTYIHAGVVESTFITSPNQPLRWEIRSTGGAASIDQICGQVSSEGSNGEVGVSTSFFQNDFQANTANSSYMVQAWRLKEDYRNISVYNTNVRIMAETNDDFRWTLSLNSTINGDALSFTDQDDSAIQTAIGNSTNTTPFANFGKIIDSGFASGNTSISSILEHKIRLGSLIDGTMDIMYLHISPTTNGLDAFTSITLKEYL